MTAENDCNKNRKCKNKLDKCKKEFNPKNKDKLDYYTAQSLWECEINAIKKNKKDKNRSKSTKKNKNRSKSTKKNKNRSISTKKSNNKSFFKNIFTSLFK